LRAQQTSVAFVPYSDGNVKDSDGKRAEMVSWKQKFRNNRSIRAVVVPLRCLGFAALAVTFRLPRAGGRFSRSLIWVLYAYGKGL